MWRHVPLCTWIGRRAWERAAGTGRAAKRRRRTRRIHVCPAHRGRAGQLSRWPPGVPAARHRRGGRLGRRYVVGLWARPVGLGGLGREVFRLGGGARLRRPALRALRLVDRIERRQARVVRLGGRCGRRSRRSRLTWRVASALRRGRRAPARRRRGARRRRIWGRRCIGGGGSGRRCAAPTRLATGLAVRAGLVGVQVRVVHDAGVHALVLGSIGSKIRMHSREAAEHLFVALRNV